MYTFTEPLHMIVMEDKVANFLYQVTDDGRGVYELRALDDYNTYLGTFVHVVTKSTDPDDWFTEVHAYQCDPFARADFEDWLNGYDVLNCPLCTRSIRHGDAT